MSEFCLQKADFLVFARAPNWQKSKKSLFDFFSIWSSSKGQKSAFWSKIDFLYRPKAEISQIENWSVDFWKFRQKVTKNDCKLPKTPKASFNLKDAPHFWPNSEISTLQFFVKVATLPLAYETPHISKSPSARRHNIERHLWCRSWFFPLRKIIIEIE